MSSISELPIGALFQVLAGSHRGSEERLEAQARGLPRSAISVDVAVPCADFIPQRFFNPLFGGSQGSGEREVRFRFLPD